MRELKFRVWDSQRKIMYGCRNIHWENNGAMTFQKGSGIEMDKELGDKLMQYTGLKDKNGKEIYESDILSGDYPDEVFFDKERGQWMVRNSQNPDDTLWEILRDNNCEVIGNIYENKDLLNK